MIFEAKKDTLFSIIFYGLIAMTLCISIIAFNSIENNSEDWFGFAIVVLVLLLLIWVWYGTEYKISNNILNISAGPIKKNIPVRTIRKIEIGKTMMIGYRLGLSKGGLIIHYNSFDEIYITPQNVDKFCKALKRIHSEIEIAKNID